ncbi:MAG: hypothetical protein R2850_03745 [Bacteroidia bacterium]
MSGQAEYTVGNPLFNQVIITPAGEIIAIETEGEGEWAEFPGFRLEHSRIINGETLKIKRSNSMPASFIPDLEPVPGDELLQAPVLEIQKWFFAIVWNNC